MECWQHEYSLYATFQLQILWHTLKFSYTAFTVFVSGPWVHWVLHNRSNVRPNKLEGPPDFFHFPQIRSLNIRRVIKLLCNLAYYSTGSLSSQTKHLFPLPPAHHLYMQDDWALNFSLAHAGRDNRWDLLSKGLSFLDVDYGQSYLSTSLLADRVQSKKKSLCRVPIKKFVRTQNSASLRGRTITKQGLHKRNGARGVSLRKDSAFFWPKGFCGSAATLNKAAAQAAFAASSTKKDTGSFHRQGLASVIILTTNLAYAFPIMPTRSG